MSVQAFKIATAKILQSRLFPDDAFYLNSVDHSLFVNNKKVVLPVSGDDPGVYVNPRNFPLAVTGRMDDSYEYLLNNFVTEPSRIEWNEADLLDYPKLESMTEGHQRVLNAKIVEEMLKIWFPYGTGSAVRILRTTGAAGDVNGPAGSTGNRKKATAKDLKRMRRLFNKMNIPTEGRFALLDADMEGELTEDPEFVDYDKRGVSNVMEKGAVGKYAGFTLYTRSQAGIYNAAATTLKNGEAVATDDNLASLFWHKDMVTRAKGVVKPFYEKDSVQYNGDVFNYAVRAGGARRNDFLGVAALVQVAA